MFRSTVFAAAFFAAAPLLAGAGTPAPAAPQDQVVRGRTEGVPGARVRTVSATEAAAQVEISFGIEPFVPASARIDPDPAPASRQPQGRFYFDGSAATAAARVLVDVSRGAGATAAAPADAGLPPDLAALCRVDPQARDAMAEGLAAGF